MVESYTYDLKESGITCDVNKLDGFIVNHEPTQVYLTLTRGYQDQPGHAGAGDFVRQDRTEYYSTFRLEGLMKTSLPSANTG